MKNEQTIKIRTEDAIALCHIIDEFETFNKNLIKFLTGKKDNSELILKIWKLSTGQRCITSKKMRKFYNDNKSVIDIINKYSNILYFICQNYTLSKDSITIADNYYLFYKYILENKDKLDKIIAVLQKLKELGFKIFEFNTNLDFTEKSYFAYKEIPKNYGSFAYLDNLEVIPTYDNGIEYKSNGSNYLMRLSLPSKYITILEQIFLNDLTFDVNRLPKELTKKETFYKILALSQEKMQEYSIIRNSVDLSIGIEDLYSMYREIQSKFNKLEGVESKSKLLEKLRKVKEALEQMTTLSQEYDKQMVANNEGITESLLTKEKEAYIRRREWAKMDLD